MKTWKPQRGETVRWAEHPNVKSKIIDIKTYRNGFKKERWYVLANDLELQIDEMIKL